MCQFFSGVITKNKTLVDYNNDSHELLIQKAGLNDTTRNPKFVRVELLPQDGNIWNHNIKNWKLRVDQDFRPDWFEKKWAENEMQNEIKKLWEERFIIDDKSWRKLKDGRFWVLRSKVEARENSSVVARDNSSVVAWGNSSVVIPSSANIKIKDIQNNASVKDLSSSPIIYVANTDIKLKVFKK